MSESVACVWLRRFAPDVQARVHILPPEGAATSDDLAAASSTRVREMLARGDGGGVARMCGEGVAEELLKFKRECFRPVK